MYADRRARAHTHTQTINREDDMVQKESSLIIQKSASHIINSEQTAGCFSEPIILKMNSKGKHGKYI